VPRSAEPALEVSGSLSFTLDAPDGGASGQISGEGNRVVVSTDDPVAAFRAATARGPGQNSVGAVADLLAASGLVLQVTGPRGTVATLGDGVESRLGDLLAGSRRVRPGDVRAVRPLAVTQARSMLAPSTRRVVMLGAAPVAFAVLSRVRTRR